TSSDRVVVLRVSSPSGPNGWEGEVQLLRWDLEVSGAVACFFGNEGPSGLITLIMTPNPLSNDGKGERWVHAAPGEIHVIVCGQSTPESTSRLISGILEVVGRPE
ncbi:MAG TPA: hypothetical protein PK890_11415, partial [Terrimesophilobacter sp.]|nr:hypothetical protein [Terrimesophilobacter sp.]